MSESGIQPVLPPISRKSHRKSRNGCRNCKRRRIKCNEIHPTCGNCEKHKLHCDFNLANPVISPIQNLTSGGSSISTPPMHTPAAIASPNQSLSYTPPPPVPLNQPTSYIPSLIPAAQPRSYTPPVIPVTSPTQVSPFSQLNATDIYLWHHFFMNTYLTFNPTAASPTFWQQILPTLGFTDHYILRLMLAISALHLSRLSPSHAHTYQELAEHHYSTALLSISQPLSTITPTTSKPLYVAAVLVCFYTLAKGPQEGEYIAFNSSSSDAQWIFLLRGVRNIFEHGGENINGEIVQALMLNDFNFTYPVKSRSGPVPDFRPPLRKFREFLVENKDTGSGIDEETKCYLTALDSLWRAFVAVYESPETEHRSSKYSNSIFAWLYRLEGDFTRCLREHRPYALVILSYFTVLLRELESQWFMEGWVEHVLKGVDGFLGEEYKGWIEWPVAWMKVVRTEGLGVSSGVDI